MKKLTLAIAASVFLAGPALAADIAAGKAKAAMCAACHGAEGVSAVAMYPNLAGQKKAYITKQLNDFKSGARKDPIMSGMAAPLTDADIDNLSSYFESLK